MPRVAGDVRVPHRLRALDRQILQARIDALNLDVQVEFERAGHRLVERQLDDRPGGSAAP